MNYHDAMQQTRARTAPPPAAVARVRGRLDASLTPATDLLRTLEGPSAGAIARVRARLAGPASSLGRPARWWLGGLLLGGTAFAAAVVVPWSPPPAAPVSPMALRGSEEAPQRYPIDGVGDLSAAGQGAAHLGEHPVRIDWELGRLDLRVSPPQPPPSREPALIVATPEARLEARHAQLTVVRDALGTEIEVPEGAAVVQCGTQPTRSLAAGDTAQCLPLTPGGLLARARALHAQGAQPSEVLASLDAAVALVPSDDALVPELSAARVGPLLALGQADEALQAAESALQHRPEGRAEELHRVAARIHLIAGRCAEAVPHLEALRAPTPDEQAHLQRCQAP